MKRALRNSTQLVVLGSVLAMGPVQAEEPTELSRDAQVVTDLGDRQLYNDVTLIPPRAFNQTASPNIIIMDPAVKQVTVIPGEMDFTKEASSFAQFRAHYAFYWSLFMTMLILDAAWVE